MAERRGAVSTARIFLLIVLASCSTSTMNSYVPAHCHGTAEPFRTYTVEYQDVPLFILDVIDTSLTGALARQGLTRVSEETADVDVLVRLEIIEHAQSGAQQDIDGPPGGGRDPFGETVAPNELHRFVTHLTVDITDQRTGRLIWTGAVDRAHAIQGGETFHDERAVLLISRTFDAMFVGLTDPCE